MKVLSLFDGISCARVALDRAGIDVESYYASEIDKYAIQVSTKTYPDIHRLGSVKNVHGTTESWIYNSRDGHLLKGTGKDFDIKFDLLIGGSPCQDLSIAKAGRKGLDGEKSGLFWEYVRILKEVKPKYFILENVASMPKEARAIITDALGVEPIMINAALVSAQNRKRLFWTNIPGVTQPEDRGIMLKDILEEGEVDRDKAYAITASYHKGATWKEYKEKKNRQLVMGTKRIGYIGSDVQSHRVYSPTGKSVALSAQGGGQGAKTGLYRVALRNRGQGKVPEIGDDGKSNAITTVQTDSMVGIIQSPRGKNQGGIHTEKSPTMTSSKFEHNNHVIKEEGFIIRKLTPVECERLQGLPDGYTEGVSNTQRYKMLGNAFNVDVIAHILSFIKV